MGEAKIRDKLATNLSIFGMGLKLIKTEYYLPNIMGTRGFVDILAKDEDGRYVIIELKRSNSSAREAIHEVLKYTEGLKANMSLKDDEIKVIIVSTEWAELLIPFSTFISKTNSEILGFNLSIDKDFNPLYVKLVTPVIYRNERMLSDLHMCYQYYSEDSLKKGIDSVIYFYESKGVKDYVMVILRCISSNSSPLKFMIYTTSQFLKNEEYLDVINKNRDDFEYFDENELDLLKGIDKANYLYSMVILDSMPGPSNDYVQIGTPAKFTHDILENGWDVRDIIRGGAIRNNYLLEDEVILSELKGLDGKNHQIYRKSFQSLKQLKNALKDTSRCLEHNHVWLSGIKSAFEDIENRLGDKDKLIAEIFIFNPSNTIFTINEVIKSAINHEDTDQWIPCYYIDVTDGDILYKYYGCLVENKEEIKNITLQDVIDEFYGGNALSYLLTHISGGYEKRDCHIATTYGIKYANFFCLYNHSTLKRESFYYSGFNYIISDATHPYQWAHDFLRERNAFCKEIVAFYENHMCDGFFIT